VDDLKFSRCVVALLRGIVFKERQFDIWATVLEEKTKISDYVQKIGLELIIDEIDNYAYLRQAELSEVPRLVPRHQLSYPVSLILVMLRKSMGEYDAVNGDSRLIITKADIIEKMRGFFRPKANEVKFVGEMERHIQRIVDMGFLRPLKDGDTAYEIEPVLKSFVTASWLSEFEERLQDFAARYAAGDTEREGDELNGFI
jgi:hypothetical protein